MGEVIRENDRRAFRREQQGRFFQTEALISVHGAKRRQLGKAARERVIANFTEAEMIRRYLELYREVLDGS